MQTGRSPPIQLNVIFTAIDYVRYLISLVRLNVTEATRRDAEMQPS